VSVVAVGVDVGCTKALAQIVAREWAPVASECVS